MNEIQKWEVELAYRRVVRLFPAIHVDARTIEEAMDAAKRETPADVQDIFVWSAKRLGCGL